MARVRKRMVTANQKRWIRKTTKGPRGGHPTPVCRGAVGLVVVKGEPGAGQGVLHMVHNGALNGVHICVVDGRSRARGQRSGAGGLGRKKKVTVTNKASQGDKKRGQPSQAKRTRRQVAGHQCPQLVALPAGGLRLHLRLLLQVRGLGAQQGASCKGQKGQGRPGNRGDSWFWGQARHTTATQVRPPRAAGHPLQTPQALPNIHHKQFLACCGAGQTIGNGGEGRTAVVGALGRGGGGLHFFGEFVFWGAALFSPTHFKAQTLGGVFFFALHVNRTPALGTPKAGASPCDAGTSPPCRTGR